MPSASRCTASRPVADLIVATTIALHVEMAWREACEETGATWPEGHCVEAAIDVRDALYGAGITAAMIWGGFEVGQADSPAWDRAMENPVHVDNGLPRGQLGHAWVALEDGTIIDPTAGQFFTEGPALRMFKPEHPMYERFHPLEVYPPPGAEG